MNSSPDISQPLRNKPPSFPQFSKLPVELRLRIWELSLPGPRIVLIREERTGDGEFIEFESYSRRYEKRREFRKHFRSETVEMIRLGEELDIFDWEDEFRLKEAEDEFGLLERDQYGDSEDDKNDGDEYWGDGDKGDSLEDDGPYGNGWYDQRIQDFWVANRSQIKPKKLEVDSSAKRMEGQSVKLANIPHMNCASRAGSPLADECDVVHQSRWCLRSLCSLPSLFYTCRESASVATRKYHNSFNGRDSVVSKVHFDFESDTLYLDTRTFLEKFASDEIAGLQPLTRYDLRNFDKAELAKVKYLALDWDDWYERERSLSWMLGYFPSLVELTMVVNDSEKKFDLSNLFFTTVRDIDDFIYEYEEDPWPTVLDDQDKKSNLASHYPSLFQHDIFREHIMKEMRRRLIGSDRSWQATNVKLRTLSDESTNERMNKASKAYWDKVNAAFLRMYAY